MNTMIPMCEHCHNLKNKVAILQSEIDHRILDFERAKYALINILNRIERGDIKARGSFAGAYAFYVNAFKEIEKEQRDEHK